MGRAVIAFGASIVISAVIEVIRRLRPRGHRRQCGWRTSKHEYLSAEGEPEPLCR
jgi:hypothetical protein